MTKTATGNELPQQPGRPGSVTPAGGQPCPIRWFTDHVGIVVLPDPQGLVGRFVTAIVLSRPTEPSQCSLVLPTGSNDVEAEAHGQLAHAILTLADDVAGLRKRIDALELGVVQP